MPTELSTFHSFLISRRAPNWLARCRFEWKTRKLNPEIDVAGDTTNADSTRSVQLYLENCRCELTGHYVDTEILDYVAPALTGVPLRSGTQAPPPIPPNRVKREAST